MATKLDAAKGAWLSAYQGKEVNYDQWLLERIAEVCVCVCGGAG
jgi:hypothetical protein